MMLAMMYAGQVHETKVSMLAEAHGKTMVFVSLVTVCLHRWRNNIAEGPLYTHIFFYQTFIWLTAMVDGNRAMKYCVWLGRTGHVSGSITHARWLESPCDISPMAVQRQPT